jgi:hypothetical protein
MNKRRKAAGADVVKEYQLFEKNLTRHIMKMVIIMLVLLALTGTMAAQQLTPLDSIQRAELLRKSKRQKTTANILLYTGIVAVPAGFMLFFVNALGGSEDAALNGAGLLTIGSLSLIGSIPFYVHAAKNKRIAMGLTTGIKLEKGIDNKRYPALTVHVKLK